MQEQIHPAFDAERESVDTRALVQRLGSADELTTLGLIASSDHLTRIHSVSALREFLNHYTREVLGPREFREISQAYHFANQNFLRDLLDLDKALAGEHGSGRFPLASRQAGKRQLNRMRHFQDLRMLQRYRQAVNEGTACGWHTLVYGLVLSTYSLPLRQGLFHYGRQTMRGFITAAARALDLRDDVCLDLQARTNGVLPALIDQTIQANGCAIKLIR